MLERIVDRTEFEGDFHGGEWFMKVLYKSKGASSENMWWALNLLGICDNLHILFSFTQWRAMIHYLRYPNVDFNKMLEFLYQYDITKFPYWCNYVIHCHINHCTAQHLHYWCALMLKVLETKWNEVVSTCQATWLEDRAAQLASDGMVRCCDNASVLCYRVGLG